MGMLTRDQVSIIQSMVAGNMVAAGNTGMDPTVAYAAQAATTCYPQTGYADPNAAYGAQVNISAKNVFEAESQFPLFMETDVFLHHPVVY